MRMNLPSDATLRHFGLSLTLSESHFTAWQRKRRSFSVLNDPSLSCPFSQLLSTFSLVCLLVSAPPFPRQCNPSPSHSHPSSPHVQTISACFVSPPLLSPLHPSFLLTSR